MLNNNFKSNPIILNEARDYISGLMLGDGNIYCANSKTGHYQHGCKYKNWLDIISEDLYEYGIECGVDNGRLITGGFCPDGGSIAYNLWTYCYIEFKEMHDRFYIKWYDIDKYPKKNWHKDEDGEYFIWKKIVPKDICLSPECVANWYLGDGSTHKYTYQKGYQTLLSTDGFLKEDTMLLADLLSEVLDIKCSVDKAGRVGIYNQVDVSTFLNYAKNYKVDCYSKKFPEDAMRKYYKVIS